jgi:hypothetical protein
MEDLMENILLDNEISLWDFIQSTVYFLQTMLVFFGLKDKKYRWVNHLLLGVFTIHWVVVLIIHKPLATKIFTTLLMVSIIIVELVITRMRKPDNQ